MKAESFRVGLKVPYASLWRNGLWSVTVLCFFKKMADIKEQNFHVSNWATLQQKLSRCWNFLSERKLWAEIKHSVGYQTSKWSDIWWVMLKVRDVCWWIKRRDVCHKSRNLSIKTDMLLFTSPIINWESYLEHTKKKYDTGCEWCH